MIRRLMRGLFVSGIAVTSCGATPWISMVAENQLTSEGVVLTPLRDKGQLLRIEMEKEKNQFPTAMIHAPEGSWDLSTVAEICTTFKNTGDSAFKVDFWAVGAPGWDAPVESISLEPGEESGCAIDLRQRWKGGLVDKVDAAHIEYLRVSLNKPPKGCRLEMGPVFLKGTVVPQKQPEGYKRLDLPSMIDDAPAAGLRVRDQLPQYEGSELYHALYLPTDWEPGKRYPIIVEYSGNRWFSAPCHSTGRPEGSRMGYGMSEGKGFIWVNAPFVNPKTKTLALNGWGDIEASIDYAIELVNYLCENFGGDPSSVILTGFSRGAVACGFIGRYNDRIADVWLAFHPSQHYDGDGIHGATYEGALTERGPRIKGRSTFQTDNEHNEKLRTLFEQLGAPVIYANSELGAHTDTGFLENRPSTLAVRDWLADIVAKKPGTYCVSGRVSDAAGNGLSEIRVQSGATHFTCTAADGSYQLCGLISGERVFTASGAGRVQKKKMQLAGRDISQFNFVLRNERTVK